MISVIILAGGTGSRMKNSGMPKQFLMVHGKPIICHTIEVFENVEEIDQIIIPCNIDWVKHMKKLVKKFGFTKVVSIIPGGKDRNDSILAGIEALGEYENDDIVLIHDGVRPLVKESTIEKNIETAKKYGNAMTVKKNIETVVITDQEIAEYNDFMNRNNTYTLTAPQTFRVGELLEVYHSVDTESNIAVPLLDPSLMYAYLGKSMHLVKETGLNLKITTPEDYYYLKAYLELDENMNILGL